MLLESHARKRNFCLVKVPFLQERECNGEHEADYYRLGTKEGVLAVCKYSTHERKRNGDRRCRKEF